MGAGGIEGVLEEMDAVVDRARRDASRLGYFAALYRRVTRAVAEGIEAGAFEDGARMEDFDVRFARRYLDAHAAHSRGERVTESWRVCFAAALDPKPIVLQHLVLGMNAHINLDLGITAAETGSASALPGLRGDFDRINALLVSMIDDVQRDLARIWPLLRPLDWLAGRKEERLAGFSIEVARDQAWRFAQALAPLGEDDRSELIRRKDRWIALFGTRLHRPPWVLRLPQVFIRLGERGSVPEIIAALS